MIARTIAVTTHGRYLVAPAHSESPAGLLVGFHGYAEPAAAALERLQTITDAGHWHVVAIQGLNRFYRGRSTDVVASWMTREDRELTIADNVTYVSTVIEAAAQECGRIGAGLVFAGFSQGVAMAYRAASASVRAVSGMISLGGDVPPELDRTALARIPAALIGRGSRDEWYTEQKLVSDVARLRAASVSVTVVTLDAGHEWTAGFSEAAADFLRNVRR